MTPSQDTIIDPKVEFDEALDRFYKSKGDDLSYRELLRKNPNLLNYFKEVLEKQLGIPNLEYIDLHLEKDKEFPDIKIYGIGILLNVILCFRGEEALNFIQKHIDKLKSQISDKDEDGNNLIAVLITTDEVLNGFSYDEAISIIKILIEHEVPVDDKNNEGLTCLNYCYNLEIFKILAQKVDDETLKRSLIYFVENEDNSDSRYYEIFDFAKEERNVEIGNSLKVKIDGFLYWVFNYTNDKNKFVDLVFNHGDEETKTNFIAQLSSSIPEERSKFFEGLSEDSRSMILGQLNEQLSKQQKFESTLSEVEKHQQLDPDGVVGSIYNHKVFYNERGERNNFIQEIKDNESRKISFISELCDAKESSENTMDKSNFFIGLNPENVQIILDQLKKTVEGFKVPENFARELQPASIAQEQELQTASIDQMQELQPTLTDQMQPISPNSSDPKVGDKRPRENSDEELDEELRCRQSDKKPSTSTMTSSAIFNKLLSNSPHTADERGLDL